MARAIRLLMLAAACVAVTRADAAADVIDRSPSGFTVRTTLTVAVPAERAYRGLLNVGAWWDREHTYSGDSQNLSLVAQAGGCFCETLPGGGAVEHGRVINFSPGKLLRLSTALGPLQELAVAGTMTWQFEPAAQGKGSTITLTYAVAGYTPGGLDKVAGVVDAVLARQAQLLKAHVEKGQ